MFFPTALAVATLLPAQTPSTPKFEILDGDRIVWIGDTLVEREQRFGYWEAALHMAFPNKRFTVRNLGWSGDTVFGDARAGFDNQAKGFERLVSLTLELKPTVIFVSYGANESFEGAAGLPKFKQGLEKLLDALKPADARVVLFSPAPVFKLETPPGFPDPKARNASLKDYGTAVKGVARARGLPFADLYQSISAVFDSLDKVAETSGKPGSGTEAVVHFLKLTENGVHLTSDGYYATTDAFLDAALQLKSPALPVAKPLDASRASIIEKNQLFFYRWRPQNETYLFGFRKHEQGKNAKEVAEFDPLTAKAEDQINQLMKPYRKSK